MDLKYSLVISQYSYSRHMFIVKIDENFIDKARECAVELMAYKRGDAVTDKTYLGDLDPEYTQDKKTRQRYNINDYGDIYFINFTYATRCMYEAFKYKEDSRRESAGYQKKGLVQQISRHHDLNKVRDIISKHFEIA